MKIKKYHLFFVILLFAIPIGFASNLTRTFSKLEVLLGEEIAVNYSVDPPNSEFWTVDEIIPDGWQVKEAEVYKGHLRWYVTQIPFKTYTFMAPNERGIYDFDEGSYQIYGDDEWYAFDPTKIKVAEECMKIYSPLNGNNYSDKKIKLNMTLLEQTEYLNCIDYADKRPRATILCRNCNEYGNSKKKDKTFNDGYHNLSIFTDDGLCNKTISFFIDSKKPRITKQEPRNKDYCNGNFKVHYSEEYLKNIYLYYGNDVSVKDNCLSRRNQECVFNVPLAQYENQNIKFHFEVEDTFWKIPYRSNYTCLVDTIPPKFTYFNWMVDGRYLYLNISLDDEAKSIRYIDYYDSRKIEGSLCTRCNEYGASRIKKKLFREGYHNLTIVAEDKAGNKEMRNFNFAISIL